LRRWLALPCLATFDPCPRAVELDRVISTGWTREGDKVRCHHGTLFDPSMEQCDKCVAEPAVDQDDIDEPLPVPPPGCMNSNEVEAWFIAIARAARRSARSVAGKGVRSNEGEIAKHRDTAIKAMRAASEFTLRRENEHLVRAREKRIMDRSRGHH
jgi:hypothetical protein